MGSQSVATPGTARLLNRPSPRKLVVSKGDLESLREDHAPHRIRERISAAPRSSYLADAVLGGIDGCVTTLVIVAGSIGAQFPPLVAMVLGVANLVADGFSMAVSNFQSATTRQDLLERTRRDEQWQVRKIPEGEIEEIREIFSRKGFSGEGLEKVVAVITADADRWVDTMLVEEHGLSLTVPRPWKSALSTFAAFVVVGAIPLLPLFVISLDTSEVLLASAFLSLLAFFAIGFLKGHLLGIRKWRSGLTTLISGGMAAALAYAIGGWLRGLAGNW